MKKIMLAILFLAGIFSTQSFASDGTIISQEARTAFQRNFPTAQFAKWKQLDEGGIYMVRFLYKNQGVIGYVSEEGEILAIARRVELDNMSLSASKAIEAKAANATILSIDELTTNDEISYLVSLQDDNSRKLLRVYANGSTTLEKKEKLR